MAGRRQQERKQISRAQARDALLRSGYLLETRLEDVLLNRERGYYVQANTAVPDPFTAKSRELDLYAITHVAAGADMADLAFACLLIECVNNPQPLALFTKEPQVPFLHHYEVKLSGLPVKMPDGDDPESWQKLADYLDMNKYHHYCRGRVATQFCSFVPKKNDSGWMATHGEPQFDSFQKLCIATDHFTHRHFKDWDFGNHEPLNLEFYYPLVVLQGELLDVRTSARSCTLRRTDHIQYRCSRIVAEEEVDYQIDVITEPFFPAYLDIVEAELSKTARLLRRRHVAVRDAIDRIAKDATDAASPEDKQAAMQF